MASPLTSSNRVNIPAVCRLRKTTTGATAGTGVLVAPGIILTSRYAVGECKEDAAALTATFFEGTKKRVVDVRLLPDKYFFTAAYPDHMDYCLVACEEGPLLHVVPVHVPLTQKEWTAVCEGDVVLVVQHPTAETGNASDDDEEDGAGAEGQSTRQSPANGYNALEQKRFEEVLRCRDSLYYLKTNGLMRTAGCPAFNDIGHLIGLQSQRQGADGEGVVNRILSIVSIVKHMFAMKQLSVLPQQQLVGPAAFEDIWATWFTDKDVTRVYTILANFRGKETVREVTRRLCEMTAKADSTVNAQEEAGMVSIILANLVVFPNDEELAELGLRALWNVSVGNHTVLHAIAQENGVQTVVTMMESFPRNEEILQFGAVILCNMADADVDVFAHPRVAERLLVLLLTAVKVFKESLVLQKFSLAMLTRLLRWQQQQQQQGWSAGSGSAVMSSPCGGSASLCGPSAFALRMVEEGMFEHARFLLDRYRQGQLFLTERVLEFVAELAQDRKAVELGRGMSRAHTDEIAPVTTPKAAVVAYGCASTSNYLSNHLIDNLVEVMLANVGNDAIMVSGNAALWGLGNVPEYRAAILLNPKSQEVLRLSIPSLMASAK